MSVGKIRECQNLRFFLKKNMNFIRVVLEFGLESLAHYGDFGILEGKKEWFWTSFALEYCTLLWGFRNFEGQKERMFSPSFPQNSNRFARRITRSLWGFRDFGGNLSTILNNFRLGVSHATMGISGFWRTKKNQNDVLFKNYYIFSLFWTTI